MVLKRKRGDEFVPVHGGQDHQPLPAAPEQESVVKKTRTNPPRSARTAPTTMSAPADTSLPKKPRAPRKKKVANPIEADPASSLSMPQAGPSQPTVPAKRGRKKTVDDGGQSEPEKRKAQFKPRCPQNILERVDRVMSQRFFMIDRQREGDELREQFSVLGSTGNVYTVTIDHLPRCNCPDAARGNHCKHILFVFLKVLGVTRESGLWYQKALLTNELEEIFREARIAPNARAHERILEAYAHATGKAVGPSTGSTSNKRQPGEEDDCPICYDHMHGLPESSLVFCEECGNAIHKECFAEWRKTSQNTGKELTCVYCRSRWVVPGPSGAAAIKKTHGYLNLATIAGVSPVRDTSTYYHGPRRGERNYGFNDYAD